MKYKVLWIEKESQIAEIKEGLCQILTDEPDDFHKPWYVHVIEHQALVDANAEIERLKQENERLKGLLPPFNPFGIED